MTRDVFDYDEFGGSLYPSFRNQPFTFTGYQKDDISETYFAQAREYVPELKRFMSQDKIAGFVGAPQTLNPYTYCWNQPQSYVDLDGKTAGRPPRPSRQETEHEDLEVWLVHGSFGCPEHYDDEFINYLARRLNIPVENIHVPQWSGDLSISDRRSYGHGIASDINARHGGSSTNVLIVGYSHGGNVARRALNRLHLHYGFDMSNVGFITLGTPMRNDYRLRWGINNNLAFHLNIFNDLDSVQLYGTIHGSPFIGPERPGIIMDGWLPRVVLPGRYAPGATNIRVTNYIPERFDYRYVGVPAHGAMHSNPELWEHYFIDLIVF